MINAFFTTCAGVCPATSGKLAAPQTRLGDRLGRDVFFISLSVDPETDNPDKLRAYVQRFDVLPDWTFLGGKKENVDWALCRVGQYVDNKEAHTNILMAGNEPTKLWRKVFRLTSVDELVRVVTETSDEGKELA